MKMKTKGKWGRTYTQPKAIVDNLNNERVAELKEFNLKEKRKENKCKECGMIINKSSEYCSANCENKMKKELPTTNCGKLPKEFNLKEKRKELLNTCRGNSDSLRIINEVENQDKEFIRRDWNIMVKFIEGEINLEELMKRRNKLSGGL